MQKCQVEGCERLTHRKQNAYCSKHYWRFQKYGSPELPPKDNKRSNALYPLWWDRKSNGSLGPEWQDFRRFAADISPKPEGHYFLVRLRDEPYGPTNFQWQEHLKRKEGESKKDWWARKRRARIANIPSMDRKRDLMRKFGITLDQYDTMKAKQDGKCAICNEYEKSFEPKTGTRKGLAVDHCHETQKVRELLCWRCNACLGKVGDSIELLEKMIVYLRKHE